MKHPEWVQAKVRLGLATCWAAYEGGDLTVCGAGWFHDVLLDLSIAFLDYCVLPFCKDAPCLPIRVLEVYDIDFADRYFNESEAD